MNISIVNSVPIAVRCSPPTGTTAGATQTAQVTFTSDTDSALGTVSNLSCTAGASQATTTVSTVTFPSQLVFTTAAPRPVTVTNTGNVAASFYFRTTGAYATSFTATTLSGCGTSAGNPCTVAVGGMQDFVVGFTPGSEGDVTAGLDLVMS